MTPPSLENVADMERLLGKISYNSLTARDCLALLRSLKAVAPVKELLGRFETTAIQALAHTLDGREIMLKIQTMNLYEIEENSRAERLAEVKRSFYRAMLAIDRCLTAYAPGIGEEEKRDFRYAFFPFLYGIYAYAHPTQKQLAVMAQVGIPSAQMTVHELAYRCIRRLLPER